MESRDRLANLGIFGAAFVTWVLVGLLVTSRDPYADQVAGYLGAVLMGLAVGLTIAPVFWLGVFARHRRIAYRGDWLRAGRRGLWVGLVVTVYVALRLLGIFSLPVAVFVVALVVFAEVTLSIQR